MTTVAEALITIQSMMLFFINIRLVKLGECGRSRGWIPATFLQLSLNQLLTYFIRSSDCIDEYVICVVVIVAVVAVSCNAM